MNISGNAAKFFSTLTGFSQTVEEGNAQQNKADKLHQELCDVLKGNILKLKNENHDKSPLNKDIDQLINSLEFGLKYLNKQQAALQNRIALQKEYQDKLILLVFGKVNSGKSSFSNYFVSLCKTALNTDQVNYFYFKEGKRFPMAEPFKEGCIETTAQIQGVEIGNLVLLDSPGLHSVTEENGQVTQQYSDSADVILWLSASNSPGQTQELNELKNELSKKKTLLPILTKSDKIEEEEQLVAGELDIVSVLEMKEKSVQKIQQQDVYQRSLLKLQTLACGFQAEQLEAPVSISTHYAKNNHQDRYVLEEAGIQSLFAGLNRIYETAIEDKKDNIERQMEHYLKETKLYLVSETANHLKTLNTQLIKQIENIDQQREHLSETVINQTNLSITEIIGKHESTQNTQGIQTDVNELIQKNSSAQLMQLFSQFSKDLENSGKAFHNSIQINAKFKTQTMEYEVESPRESRSLIETCLLVGRAVINTDIDALVSIITDSPKRIDSKVISEVIGVDTQQVEKNIQAEIAYIVPAIINESIDNLIHTLQPLQKIIESSQQSIESYQQA